MRVWQRYQIRKSPGQNIRLSHHWRTYGLFNAKFLLQNILQVEFHQILLQISPVTVIWPDMPTCSDENMIIDVLMIFSFKNQYLFNLHSSHWPCPSQPSHNPSTHYLFLFSYEQVKRPWIFSHSSISNLQGYKYTCTTTQKINFKLLQKTEYFNVKTQLYYPWEYTQNYSTIAPIKPIPLANLNA